MRTVIKVLRASEWMAFEATGAFAGSVDDQRDGFIHLSTPDQLGGTLARHFTGETELWRLDFDADALGAALRWEVSRGGAAFPHLYRSLVKGDVIATAAL